MDSHIAMVKRTDRMLPATGNRKPSRELAGIA